MESPCPNIATAADGKNCDCISAVCIGLIECPICEGVCTVAPVTMSHAYAVWRESIPDANSRPELRAAFEAGFNAGKV